MLLSSHALKSLNSLEKIQHRMCGSFNSNPNTTIIFCYSPTHAMGDFTREQVAFLHTLFQKRETMDLHLPK